jgi:hypothetical protein
VSRLLASALLASALLASALLASALLASALLASALPLALTLFWLFARLLRLHRNPLCLGGNVIPGSGRTKRDSVAHDPAPFRFEGSSP